MLLPALFAAVTATAPVASPQELLWSHRVDLDGDRTPERISLRSGDVAPGPRLDDAWAPTTWRNLGIVGACETDCVATLEIGTAAFPIRMYAGRQAGGIQVEVVDMLPGDGRREVLIRQEGGGDETSDARVDLFTVQDGVVEHVVVWDRGWAGDEGRLSFDRRGRITLRYWGCGFRLTRVVRRRRDGRIDLGPIRLREFDIECSG